MNPRREAEWRLYPFGKCAGRPIAECPDWALEWLAGKGFRESPAAKEELEFRKEQKNAT